MEADGSLTKLEFVAKIEPNDLLVISRHGTAYKIKANNIITTDVFLEKNKEIDNNLSATKVDLENAIDHQIQNLTEEKKKKFQEIDNKFITLLKSHKTELKENLITLVHQLSVDTAKAFVSIDTKLRQKTEEEKTNLDQHLGLIHDKINLQKEGFYSKIETQGLLQDIYDSIKNVDIKVDEIPDKNNIQILIDDINKQLIQADQQINLVKAQILNSNEQFKSLNEDTLNVCIQKCLENLQEITSFKQSIFNTISEERSNILETIRQQTDHVSSLVPNLNNIEIRVNETKAEVAAQTKANQHKQLTLEQSVNSLILEISHIKEDHQTELNNVKQILESKEATINLLQNQVTQILSNQDSFLKKSELPPGIIAFWPHESIPEHWMACEGQMLDKNEYPELFLNIRYKYGGKEDTFCLPNANGQFIRCWNTKGSRSVGSYQPDSIKEHKHIFLQSNEEEMNQTSEIQSLSGMPFNFFELTNVSSPQFSEQKLGIGPDFIANESKIGFVDSQEGPFVSIGHNIGSEKETRPCNITLVCCIKIK